MYSIVFITFHIGNFLSVSGFGHAICDSFRNEHVVILLDMMLRARIARMNMRAMMVIVIGSIIMMNKGKRRSARRRNKQFHKASELHDFDNDNNDDEHDMTFIEIRDCSSLRSMPRSTKLSASGFG